MSFVYIIQNQINNKYYIGSCVDLEKRILRHKNHTGGLTTKTGIWNLVCYKEFFDINEARNIEKLLKSYKGGNSFKKVLEDWRRGESTSSR